MKKIILACCVFTALAPAAQAQALLGAQSSLRNSSTEGVSTTTTTLTLDNGSSATVITPGLGNTTEPKLLLTDDYPVRNGGIIIPDHAYEPAGTAGVGFFGNGTGGSTIGSSVPGGGTGLQRSTKLLLPGNLATNERPGKYRRMNR